MEENVERNFARIFTGLRGMALACCAVAALNLGPPAQAQTQRFFDQGTPPSFTASQAARGKAAYSASCASCHGGDLNGAESGPALTGAAFRTRWGSQSPEALYSFMASQMPPSGAGSLASGAYADIEAYILQANGAAAGEAELPVAAPASGQGATPTASAGAARQRMPEIHWGPDNHDSVYQAAIARRTAQLDKVTPVTDEMLRHPSNADWIFWRRDYQGLGFSPLRQINKSNVRNLRVAWSWSLPVSPDEITPLVHDGILFIQSANRVQALDGASGDLLWEYTRSLPEALNNGRTAIAKNIAIYQDKLYTPAADGHMVALDIKTGKVVWDHPVISPEEEAHGVRMDGGPLVAKGKVIMGVTSCSNYQGGCFIVGLDAQTGEEAWRFHTIARPGEPGGDSWNGAPVNQRYGGAVWTSGSYDPDLNLVYYGTGQTYDTSTLLEPRAGNGQPVQKNESARKTQSPQKTQSNDALYTDSTVALDPDTGKLAWYYQHMNRDVWDLDWVFEQSLIDLPVDGVARKLVVTAGKIAVFDAVDRTNGQYMFSKDLGLQNLVSAIDPKTGKKTISAALTPAANQTKLLCPHGGGARSWPATAYNPASNILYVPLIESCSQFTWIPRDAQKTANGGNDMHWVVLPRPDSDGKFGRVEAINLETGKVVWTERQRAPIASSMLATGGGLVFNGARDREFRAFDDATGDLLWETRLNAVPSSTPITYSIDGEQYIAVVAGGGGAHEATWPSLTPEIDNPSGATTLWIFKLPSASDQMQ